MRKKKNCTLCCSWSSASWNSQLNLAGKDSQLIPKFAGKAASPPIPSYK